MYVSSSSSRSPHLMRLAARPRGFGARGFGALSPGAQTAEQISLAGASTTLGILAGMHAVIGGVALAGPIGVAIAGLLAITPLIVNLFSGCGQTCIAAANLDNQLSTILGQNLKAYFSSPNRTVSMQAAALNNFDTAWAAYVRAEQTIPTQGAISIAERQRGGASKWCCQSSTSVRVSTPCQGGPPCCTGCDYFVAYRDPIANDAAVQPDPVTAAGASLLSTVGINPSTTVGGIPVSKLLLPAAALAAIWWWSK